MAATQKVTVVCRPLPSEGVPNCSIRIGTKTATTNGSGNAAIDLSTLANGNHEAEFRAPDTSDAEMGPDFRPDTSKLRVWRSLTGSVEVQGGRIVSADPSDVLVVSRQPASRPAAACLAEIAFGRCAARGRSIRSSSITRRAISEGDLNTFLYGNRVSIHYLVAPNGDVYKLVMEDRKASHAGYSHWQGDENLNGTSIGIEMTHRSGPYPQAQVDATVALVEKLHRAFPAIPAGRVIGHSDVGICEPTSDKSLHARGAEAAGAQVQRSRFDISLGADRATRARPSDYPGNHVSKCVWWIFRIETERKACLAATMTMRIVSAARS